MYNYLFAFLNIYIYKFNIQNTFYTFNCMYIIITFIIYIYLFTIIIYILHVKYLKNLIVAVFYEKWNTEILKKFTIFRFFSLHEVRNPDSKDIFWNARPVLTFFCVRHVQRIHAMRFTHLSKRIFSSYIYTHGTWCTFEFLCVCYTRDITVSIRVCIRIYGCAQVICTRIAFAIYGHTEIRVCAAFIHVYTYIYIRTQLARLCARLDYIYNLYACVYAYRCMYKSMYWQNAWKYTCVRARVHVCTCGLPAYFVILIARGRPPPLLQPNSAPSLPTPYCTAPLHPMLTPPFLCASSSCSTRRHPSENLRLSDDSTSSHTSFLVC